MMNDMLVTINGVTAHLGVWAKKYGLTEDSIARRVKLGLTLEEAITVPKNELRAYLKRKNERQRRTFLVKEKDMPEVRNEKRAAKRPVQKKRPVVFYRASSGSGYYDYVQED